MIPFPRYIIEVKTIKVLHGVGSMVLSVQKMCVNVHAWRGLSIQALCKESNPVKVHAKFLNSVASVEGNLRGVVRETFHCKPFVLIEYFFTLRMHCFFKILNKYVLKNLFSLKHE